MPGQRDEARERGVEIGVRAAVQRERAGDVRRGERDQALAARAGDPKRRQIVDARAGQARRRR